MAPQEAEPVLDLAQLHDQRQFQGKGLLERNLARVAAAGQLSRPGVLEQQTLRMLADGRLTTIKHGVTRFRIRMAERPPQQGEEQSLDPGAGDGEEDGSETDWLSRLTDALGGDGDSEETLSMRATAATPRDITISTFLDRMEAFPEGTGLTVIIAFTSEDREKAAKGQPEPKKDDKNPTPKKEPGPYGHRDQVFSSALSKDGKFLASSSSDKTVKLWNAADGKPIRTIEAGHLEAPAQQQGGRDDSKRKDGRKSRRDARQGRDGEQRESREQDCRFGDQLGQNAFHGPLI